MPLDGLPVPVILFGNRRGVFIFFRGAIQMGAVFGVTAKTASGKDVFFRVAEIDVPPAVKRGVGSLSTSVGSAAKAGVNSAKKGVTEAKKVAKSQTEKAEVTINAVTQVDFSKISPDHTKQIVDKLKSTQHESMLPNASGHGRVGSVSSSADINHALNQIGLVGLGGFTICRF
jgi:hypothetical protein